MGTTNFDGYPITHGASTDLTNPATTDVLADTGPLEGGMYDLRLLLGASAVAKFLVQRRNAANDANVGDPVIVYVAAGQSEGVMWRMLLEPNERVRVTMFANLTGTGAAAISAQRVA